MAPEPTPHEAARKLIEPIIKAQLHEAIYERQTIEERRASRKTAQRLMAQVALRFFKPEEAAKVLLAADRQLASRIRRETARRNQHALRRPRTRMTVAASRPVRARGRERRASRAARAGPDDDEPAPRPRRSAPLNPDVPSRRSRDDHPCPPHWRRR